MEKSRWGVHEGHCCVEHGCKYGDYDCPVELGLTFQDKPCEACLNLYYEGYSEDVLRDRLESLARVRGGITEARERGMDSVTVRIEDIEKLLGID